MKNPLLHITALRSSCAALALSLAFATSSWAGSLDIAEQPLATGTGLSVKPNLLFILDDSGSMGSDYTPDWVNDSICQNSLSSYGNTHSCENGYSSNRADPPYMSNNFNKQYYNPATRYRSPKSYTGTEWAAANPEAAVTGDIFRGSTSTTNLKTSYPDAYWCKSWSDTAPGPNCHNNEGTHYGYNYPNSVWSVQKNVNGPPYYYLMSGSPTWCSDDSLTTCQASRSSTYKYPRFADPVAVEAGAAGTPEVQATRAKITITVSKSTSGKKIQTVKCGKDSTGATVFSGTYTLPDSNNSTLANWLKTELADCSDPAAGAWVVTYPSASGSYNEIDVSWPVTGTGGNGQKFYIWIDTDSGSSFTVTIGGTAIDSSSMASLYGATLSGGQNYQAADPGTADVITFPTSGVQFQKIVIDPAVQTQYDKGANRSDCIEVTDGSDPYADGLHCSYKQELQNFANWYQFYRTRMLMMKSSVSRVFAGVSDTAPGNGFRVGFDRISRSSADLEQNIGTFVTTAGGQKQNFYSYLFASNPSSSTPLRGALSKAGRLYAGALAADPVQVSCQQNFTFLSTDGYWNTGNETTSYTALREDGTTAIGHQDGAGAPAAAAAVTLSVTTAYSGYQITQIKCGATSAGANTITETYTISGSSGSERRRNTAAWLATKLTQCSNPTEGSWQIGYTSGQQTISIAWPITGPSGNGKLFYLDIVVSNTSNVVATLGGTTITKSSMPGTLDSAALSGGSAPIASQDRPQLDALAVEDSLADIAMYYWKNDLRTSLTNDVPMSSRDPASWQHMTTFTMGLGIDGTLRYASDYETGGSPDFNEIVAGTRDWPDPIRNSTDQRIDDLWHAAVNGRGLYFSASSPDEVVEYVNTAISTIASVTGAAAAAATSNLEPTAGDNYAYVASYRTQVWDGDLQAKEIDLLTGALSDVSSWSSAYQLGSQASRTLYTFDTGSAATDKKRTLNWAGLSGTEQGYFAPTQLNQCSPIEMCPGATAQNLFEYLMGGTDTTSNHSYRARQSVTDPANAASAPVANRFGDIVSSQPVFVGAPNLLYTEHSYSSFKTGAAASRGKTVYVGANDGFIHAINADTGVERWAYMPRPLLPNLYKLARTDYTHAYYQDGSIAVTDAHNGTTWRTMLVAGMNKGGHYYTALDVTDPAAPQALWEFTDTTLGYSYGNPIITKLPSGATSAAGAGIGGRWVVLLTSGYNNSGGNGQGVVYVLDVFTGAELFRMTTTSASASSGSPIGLAKINAWADDPGADNTATYVYGGDLNGDLWRFELATKAVVKIAEVGEPITVKPELGEITAGTSAYRVVMFGTGLFLQDADKSDASQRTIFAVKDTGTTLTNVKASGEFVQQTLSAVGDTHRTTTSASVDWSVKHGWFVNLLDSRERVNVDPKLVLGTLVVASNVPQDTSADSCTAGGYSWLNYLDMTTGAYVASTQTNPEHYASTKLSNALTVGINVVKLPSGKIVGIVTTSDNKHWPLDLPTGGASGGAVRRISWRELVTE